MVGNNGVIMDPDETLNKILALAVDILDTEENDQTLIQLAESVSDLDIWLHNGGRLPERWKHAEQADK